MPKRVEGFYCFARSEWMGNINSSINKHAAQTNCRLIRKSRTAKYQ